MRQLTRIFFVFVAIGFQYGNCLSEEKLPGLLKSNTILVGQLYGCLTRVEQYAKLSAQQPDSKFKPEEYVKVASSVLGIDVQSLKDDLLKLPLAFPTPEDIKRFDAMMEKISAAEFNDKGGLSWAQSASCAVLIHNLGLFDKYILVQK